MKKSLLILLPLVTLALTGCRRNSGDSSSSQPSETKPTTTISSSSGPTTPQPTSSSTSSVVPSGSEHALPWSLMPQDCYQGDGYVATEGTRDFDGTKVTLHNMNINSDPASVKTTLYVFQFAKKTHDKYPQGELTVSKVKPSSVTVKALVKSSYTWSSNQIGTVTFGSQNVSVPSTSQSEVASDYSTEWSYHTVTLNVNASSAQDFKISNTGTFAFYIVSIEFNK